jgi:threonine dehydrogenase-like Zn-dependent dehydrogenase
MHVPRFLGQGKIDFVERPVPEPGPGQLLLQVKANALCGSERSQFLKGSEVTPGHEAAGVVVASGPDTHTAIGTPGVVFLMDFCGACRSCQIGSTNQCLSKRGDMGFNKDGGYAPYELIRESIFFPVGEDIPLVEATMLLDVMGTSAHAIKRARLVHPDIQSVVVTGAGPVGLGVLAMAKLIFGEEMPVLVSDIVPYRLQLAERLGARPIDLREQTLEQGVRGHGLPAVDLAIDSSGKSAARQAGLAVLDRRGVLVCVGHGETLTLQVSPDLIAMERAVLGSEYFRYDELGENLQRLAAHRSYIGQIITHRYPLDNIQAAFKLFFAGDTGKVVVEQ